MTPQQLATSSGTTSSLGTVDPPEIGNFTTARGLPHWQNHKPQWRNWYQFNIAVQQGYKLSQWVYLCVTRRATDAASIPWMIEKRNSAGEWKRVKNHDLEEWFKQPNPKMPGSDLIWRVTASLFLGGNAIWSKVRSGSGLGGRGTLKEIWPIELDAIKPVPDALDFISYYSYYYLNVGPYRIDPDNIVHFQLPDPSNPWWGCSPITAAGRIIDTQIDAVAWNKVALQNRAVSDGVFSTDQRLTRSQYDDVKDMVRDQHQGSANARTPWIVSNGMKWQPMGMSPVEMDFIQSMKLYREEICSIFGIPPIMVGILENSSYNNITTARTIYWEDTMIPFLKDLRDCINHAIISVDYPDSGLRFNMDLSAVEPLQANLGEKISQYQILVSVGVPPNVANERIGLGLPDLEGGDVGLISLALGPIENVAEGDTLPQKAPSAPTPDDTLPPELGPMLGAATKPAPPPMPGFPPKKKPKPGLLGQKPGGPGQQVVGLRATDKGNQEMQTPTGKKTFRLMQPSRPSCRGVKSAEQRADYWHFMERHRLSQEAAVAKTIAGLFAREEQKVLAAYRNRHKNLDLYIDSISNDWAKSVKGIWTSNVAMFGSATLAAMSRPKSLRYAWETKADNEWSLDPHSEGVQEALDQWVAEKIVGIRSVTKHRVAMAIEAGLKADEGMDDIARRLLDAYKGFRMQRAMTIARTEVMSASNYGAQKAAEQWGAQTKTWLSSRDERVRETHREQPEGIDGETVGIDEKFSNDCFFPGDPDGPAKETIQCRCFPAETEVQFGGLEAVTRRWYDGPMVQVRTASGHDLTGTPNHPMLTQRGWVALDELQKGDYLIRCLTTQGVGGRDPDVENVPRMVQEVFDTLACTGNLERTAGSGVDFHGDGQDGEVEIVRPHSQLQLTGESRLLKPVSELQLPSPDFGQAELAGEGELVGLSVGLMAPQHGSVGRLGQSKASLNAGLTHAQEHGFGSVAAMDTVALQDFMNGASLQPNLKGDHLLGHAALVEAQDLGNQIGMACYVTQRRSLSYATGGDPNSPQAVQDEVGGSAHNPSDFTGRLASLIETDEILSVDVLPAWSGHVFNLQTDRGFYAANGFLSHNCALLYDSEGGELA